MYILFPTDLFNILLTKFTKDNNFLVAMKLLNTNKKKLEIEKEYCKTIFQYDIHWLCKKFDIILPTIT